MGKGFQFKTEFEERQRRPRESETYLISHLILRGLKKKNYYIISSFMKRKKDEKYNLFYFEKQSN